MYYIQVIILIIPVRLFQKQVYCLLQKKEAIRYKTLDFSVTRLHSLKHYIAEQFPPICLLRKILAFPVKTVHNLIIVLPALFNKSSFTSRYHSLQNPYKHIYTSQTHTLSMHSDQIYEQEQHMYNMEAIQPSQGKKFNLEMSVSEANVIGKLLPKGYTMQVDRSAKLKNKKRERKRTSYFMDSSIFSTSTDKRKPSSKSAKLPPPTTEFSMSWDSCGKMLQMLKKHKTSWPFHDPVNAVALGIPHYHTIITKPMDLTTITHKFDHKLYASPMELHSDVKLIIENSIKFNQHNKEFFKLTRQFERYYKKVVRDLTRDKQPPVSVPDRQLEISLKEKKALVSELKQLSMYKLMEVVKLVEGTESPITNELNIETLPAEKIKLIQIYLKQMQEKTEENKGHYSHESSFASDSDS